MKILIILFSIINTQMLLAAGGGHGHVSDLMYPAINVTILVLFFLWKVRPMVSKAFTNYHDQVSEAFNLAEVKEAEAQLELESAQKKLADVSKDAEQVISDATREAGIFDKKFTDETNERIQRSKSDLGRRVAAEKEEAVSDITKELVDKVVSGAKDLVGNNNDQKKKVVDSFMGRL